MHIPTFVFIFILFLKNIPLLLLYPKHVIKPLGYNLGCYIWPPYKCQLCFFVTHILEILLFPMDESNLRGMEFRSLIVSAGGSSEASGSASLDFCLWELCFSLVSP